MKPEQQLKDTFLPDFCSVRILFVVILIAELLAIVLTLAQPPMIGDRLYDLAMISLFTQWIALTCVCLLCLCRRWLNRLQDVWTVTLSYLMILAVALVITELAWWSLYILPERGNYFSRAHAIFFLRCFGISAIIGALALRYFYIQHQWRRNIESAALSQLQALQSRIRPHFLFNCMNTIASLTRKQPALAEEAIADLADLFRVSLMDEHYLSTFADEQTLCQRYLNIEKHRLGKRLNVVWETGDLPGNALMPALILQPFLENAIYHGVEPLPEGGTIKITGTRQQADLVITIDNPLPDDDSANHHNGNQLAQENVRQRIEAVFKGSGNLLIRTEDHHYVVQITIPYQTHENLDR
jgi:two-component system sensor histidine kinase AlgZ